MIPASKILEKYWGFTKFRKPQEAIIDDVVNKKDVIALLPTGSGKSVCFQVPTLMEETGVCIVVSPLIALMKDQVENLQKKGIKAVALTGFVPQDEIIRVFDNLLFGGIRFLYLSPERLQSTFIQEKIKQLPVSLFAIDEAHCISEWGHDFRPSYLSLNSIRELHPKTNIIALTATATKKVLEDISKYLELEKPSLYKQSLVRTNLHLKVMDSIDKLESLRYIVKSINEPIIVYAGSRNNCQRTSEYLNNNEIISVFYHAGLSKEAKEAAANKWYDEKAQVIVATNAFGMGIDKANVRMVVHTSVPFSIENYIQEAGRAGRDGKKSYAVIIEDISSLHKSASFFGKSIPDVDFIKKLYQHINQYFYIIYGALPKETFTFELSRFCREYGLPVLKTYNGLELLEREGILKVNTFGRSITEMVFTANNEQLFAYYRRNPKKEQILKEALRTYDGIFNTICIINTHNLATKLKISKKSLESHLDEINRDGIIQYQSGNNNSSIQFLKPREDKYTISGIVANIKQRKRIKENKYTSMLSYIENDSICRNRLLSQYFGEGKSKNCGICDVCKGKEKDKKTNAKSIRSSILAILKEEAYSSKDLIRRLELDSNVILKELRFLLDTNAIVLNSQNKYMSNE